MKKSVSKHTKFYKLVVKFMHGDADGYTEITHEFDEEIELRHILNFYFEVRNFTKDTAYKNLGRYYPFNGDGSDKKGIKLQALADKYNLELGEYIDRDHSYSDCFCPIENITLYIDNGNTEIDILDMKACNTNIISLPKIGDDALVDIDYIPGGNVEGYELSYCNYFKSKKLQKLNCQIVNIILAPVQYTEFYLTYQIIYKVETGEYIYTEINGFDPNFKFDKNEFVLENSLYR